MQAIKALMHKHLNITPVILIVCIFVVSYNISALREQTADPVKELLPAGLIVSLAASYFSGKQTRKRIIWKQRSITFNC